jgi:hypothetical protein
MSKSPWAHSQTDAAIDLAHYASAPNIRNGPQIRAEIESRYGLPVGGYLPTDVEIFLRRMAGGAPYADAFTAMTSPHLRRRG